MSQYYGNTVTNFFKVTDADKFREFVKEVKDQEQESVIFWEKKNKTDILFAFGCYSSIEGILTNESRIKEFVFEECAELYSVGQLTKNSLSIILEDIKLTELEYDKDKVTEYFHHLLNSADFSDVFEDAEYTFDGFVEELQKLLPNGEAVVITESGHEKLIDVSGSVTVITNNDCKYVTLDDVAEHLTKQMTQNENIKISYN